MASKNAAPGNSTRDSGARAMDITALRAGSGFVLSDVATDATPGFSGKKADGEALFAESTAELQELQEKLWASTRSDADQRGLLLVLQGMDTSGKGGIVKHVISGITPSGVRLTSFKAPTDEEKSHDFLWRIKKALPSPGQIGVFDRSHYEDVLIVRVLSLVPQEVWEPRYEQINDFEAELSAAGITVVKVMLHLGHEEQRARLLARLEDPKKRYKFNPGDLDQRQHWAAYQEAYQSVVDRTSPESAPWHVVPADRKWFARLAVQQLLIHHLQAMNLEWPPVTFDVEEQKARLLSS